MAEQTDRKTVDIFTDNIVEVKRLGYDRGVDLALAASGAQCDILLNCAV